MHDRQNLDLPALNSEHDQKGKTLDGTDASITMLDRKLFRIAFDAIDRFPYFVNQVISKAVYLDLVPVA